MVLCLKARESRSLPGLLNAQLIFSERFLSPCRFRGKRWFKKTAGPNLGRLFCVLRSASVVLDSQILEKRSAMSYHDPSQ